MTDQAPGRLRVVVEVADLASDVAGTVVSAAVQLFSAADPVDVVLHVRDCEEPTQAQADVVLGWCLAAVASPAQLPEVLLVGTTEARAEPAVVTVTADADAGAAARAIALLTAAAQQVWDERSPTSSSPQSSAPAPSSPPDDGRAAAQLARATAMATMARRDVRSAVDIAAGRRRPTVVGLFQHVSYWAAVEDVYRELAARDAVDFVVVGLESTADLRSGSTLDFLQQKGFQPRTAAWLLEHLDDVDAVVLENPYDEMRPWQLNVDDLVRRGVRLVGLPYGNNAIGGAFMDRLLWDKPLHRNAWRYYLPNANQRALYAQHCAAGDEPVRVLGNPKHDRLVRGTAGGDELSPVQAAWRETAAGRPVVVWNPHFRTAAGGWSTFPRHLRQLVTYAQDHDDLLLLVRPHFRLFSELRSGGLGHLERDLRSAAAAVPNLVLDESPDYRDALGIADAMLSDLSSLASEFLVTGKPLLYLHRADGPGPSAEGGYLEAAERAESWPQVEAFLDRVRAGDDDGVEERRAAVRRAFPFLDGGSARRVVDDLVRSLLDDLAVPAPADAAPAALVEPLAKVPAGLLQVAPPSAATLQAARSRPLLDAVLLTSFHGRSAGDNPLAVARELHRVGHQAERYWVVATPGAGAPDGCTAVLAGSTQHVELLSRARWVVDNDATPEFLERRPGQTVLQTWHGTPLKKLRFDLHESAPRAEATLRYLEQQARTWTHVVSPNPLTSRVLERGFRVEGTVLETGYPRNDVLADVGRRDETGAAVRRRLGVPAGQRVVLYAPTWRDDSVRPHLGGAVLDGQPSLDWAGLRSVLGDGTTFWVRAHRFVAGPTAALGGPGVVDVSDYPDMADLLAAADVLVTDYSSSFFDFSITGRPMVFFVPDLDLYRTARRAHYFQMEEVVPGPVLREAHRVTEALATVESWTPSYADRYQRFVETFAPWDDGKAAQRVVEQLFT